MNDQASLFVREPETLDGYTPKFSREEVRLGYKCSKYQTSGRGMGRWASNDDNDDDEPQYSYTYTLTILGYTWSAPVSSYGENTSLIVVELANAFLANTKNKELHPEVWQFLTVNSKDLSNSNRYWLSITHLEKIAEKQAKVDLILEDIRKARIIASVNAVEVKSGRRLESNERSILTSEFGG